mgnify:FL=1
MIFWKHLVLALALPCMMAVAQTAPPTPTPRSRLSVLAPAPDWSRLDIFQKTITRTEFLRLLNTIYAPDGAWKSVITVGPTSATVHPPGSKTPDFRLEFAPSAAAARPVPRDWKPAGSHSGATREKPLAGATIAIDPGHIGGAYAKMEERWFRIGNSKPVMEGELVLETAKILAERLTELGAKVVLLRTRNEPVTPYRPKDFVELARQELKKRGIANPRLRYNGPNDPQKMETVQWQSELLFYRVSEIRARAELVNEKIKPDLVIALHFNAEDWGDPADPQLTEKNHLHMLVNGNYSAGELANDDIRFDMLYKLLNRAAREEIPLNEAVADALAKATGLPPFEYHNPGRGRRITKNPYVWARNLLANRLYHCPVIFCEPYVMNSRPVFERVQMGDYEGTRAIGGVPRKSIIREYADAVAEGVTEWYRAKLKAQR